MEITEKQWRFIVSIESTLEIEFKGKTRKEASEYISLHIEEFKKKNYEMRKKTKKLESNIGGRIEREKSLFTICIKDFNQH